MTQLYDLPGEDQWFDDTISVTRKGAEDPVLSVLGVAFEDVALVHLCGALKGSEVACEVQLWPFDVPTAQQEPVIIITASNTEFFGPGVENMVVVRPVEGVPKKAELVVEFMSLRNEWAGQRIATMMFWRMARASLALNIERVSLLAMGGRDEKPVTLGGESRRWTGYDFWPSIGFDAVIPAKAKAFIDSNFQFYPENVKDQKQVRDYFSLSGGREMWKLCGATVSKCRFEMTADSESMKVLRKRVERFFGGHHG